MRFPREQYLRSLIAKMHNGLVKVVTGLRRCGKSYLLSHIFHEYLVSSGVTEDHIIEISLDDFAQRHLRQPDALYQHVLSCVRDKQWHYVVIDEVQMLHDFVDVLNGFLHVDNLDVYVTGSNSRFLSSDVLTEFRGRGDAIRIWPLTFGEYASVLGGRPDDTWAEYCTFGGMPYAAGLAGAEEKTAYLKQLVDTVYLADIRERHKIRQDGPLAQLLDILASGVGSLTNPAKLERSFRSAGTTVSQATIRTWIGYLLDAFVMEEAQRYDIKGKKYMTTPAKYYFTDVGLRNARLNFRQQEPTHIMENIVFNELNVRGYGVDVGLVEQNIIENNKKQRRALEIDFVANKGNRRCYVQSAFSLAEPEKRVQELRPFSLVHDSFRKIVITGGKCTPWQDDQGIVTMGVIDFLLDPNSLE